MYGSMVRFMLRRAVRNVNRGNIGPMLSSYSESAVSVFPGEHSWGGEYRGKAAIEGFLRRFVDTGLQLEPEEILVNGWPWDTTVCVRFTDGSPGPDGKVEYSNRGVIFARSKWGKIVLQETYEDTQRVADWDKRLASAGAPVT